MFADVTFIGIRWFVFVETKFKISFSLADVRFSAGT